MSTGRVALVGAGPGDPSLLTVRAAELLRAADVVAYDELISESVLALAPARAELIAVGRRAGRGETGYRLHPAVLERAQAGAFVVRLKAGDPLIFGRGGEEAEVLTEAGIPFEIVPGVSAVLGAAAYASIPLTHREHSAQLVVMSGHRADGGLPPPETIGGRTLALYMVAHELAVNLNGVTAAGWSPETPAALIIAATTPDEHVVTGTLGDLAERAERALRLRAKLPALVIVGDVVRVRATTDWRTRLPLRGQRVVVARARSGASRVGMMLRTLGADVVELPHVERAVVKEGGAWRAALASLPRYAAIAVASEEAAEALANAKIAGHELPALIAVGIDAAALLRAQGMTVAAEVDGACASALTPLHSLLRGRPVLLPTTDRGRPSLERELRALGAEVDAVAVATEQTSAPARWPSRVDLVVLPASSAATALYQHAPDHVRAAPAVAIGDTTYATAQRFGVTSITRAAVDTIEALVEAALHALREAQPAPSSGPREATSVGGGP